MIFWALVALGTSVKLAKEHRRGRRKLRERRIHSKKSMNLPRSFVGIPRAFSKRALDEFKGVVAGGSRELYFDEDSDGIFTLDTESGSMSLGTPSMDDISVASSSSEEDDEGIWC